MANHEQPLLDALDNPDEVEPIARILGVDPEPLTSYFALLKEYIDATGNGPEVLELQEYGTKMMDASKAKRAEYADEILIERPALVYFTANWCGPCQIVKPAVAQLFDHFTKGNV